MSLAFRCPECGEKLSVSDKELDFGRRNGMVMIECSKCGLKDAILVDEEGIPYSAAPL